jgi:hypothetical protein
MKKSAKSSGKKPAAKKSNKRTVTVESDMMPVEEVPEVQVQETEATPVEATVAEEAKPMEETPAEVTVAEEPKPTKAKRGRRAATSAAKDETATPKPLSCLDAAVAVLTAKGEPMRCQEMIDAMKEQNLWTSNAPTPAATLSSAILREIKKGENSRFKKTDRGHFALNV